MGADGVEIGGPEESCRAPMPGFNLECQNIRDGFLFPIPLTGKGFLSASRKEMEREKPKGEGAGRSSAPTGALSCTCTSTVTPIAHAPHLRRHPRPPATLLDMPSLLPAKHTEVRPLRGLSHGLVSVPTFISLSPRSSQRTFSCRSDPGCSTLSDETWSVWPPPTSPPIWVHVPQTLWLLWLNCVHLHPQPLFICEALTFRTSEGEHLDDRTFMEVMKLN